MSDNPEFFEASGKGVNLLNGFVKISTSGTVSLEPHSSDHRQRFMIAQEWRPTPCEIPDGFLQTLLFGSFGADDAESHQLIMEILGASITGINIGLPNPKAFVFYGPSAANGKSTIQAVIRRLLPSKVVACIAPAELGEPQFLATLAGRQVNLTDEISGSKAIATDRFKATVTGDPVQAKAIYREPFTFTPWRRGFVGYMVPDQGRYTRPTARPRRCQPSGCDGCAGDGRRRIRCLARSRDGNHRAGVR